MASSDPLPAADGQDLAAFWSDFEVLPTRFDRWLYRHWYVPAFGPLGLLVLLAVALDLVGDTRWSTTQYDLTDWILISLPVTLSLMTLTFHAWRRKIPVTFQNLLETGRLASALNGQSVKDEFRAFLDEYARAIRNPRRYWMVAALILLIPLFTWRSGMLADAGQVIVREGPLVGGLDVAHTATRWLVALLVWAYPTIAGTWPMIITGITIRNLSRRFPLDIQPRHPDRCGGLKPLGDLSLRMVVPILLGMVLLGVYGIGGAVFGAGFRSMIVTFSNLGLILVGLPLVTLAFFVPLWGVHERMLAQKLQAHEEYAGRISAIEARIRTHLDAGELAGAREAREEFEIVQALDPGAVDYPTWPFDRGILFKFLSPQIVSVTSIVFGLSDALAEAAKRALLDLFGR